MSGLRLYVKNLCLAIGILFFCRCQIRPFQSSALLEYEVVPEGGYKLDFDDITSTTTTVTQDVATEVAPVEPLPPAPEEQVRNFCEDFSFACKSFQKVMEENKSLFHQVLSKQYRLDKNQVLAIVAPEISWYSWKIDQMETLASEIFYIQLGPDYADFSLGLFQMKPSFIEKLEANVLAQPSLRRYWKEFVIVAPNEEEVRSIRIDRLKETEWQLKYLALFYLLMEERHAGKTFCSPEEKIKFYASAYNCGFEQPDDTITAFATKRLFPFGEDQADLNYAYAEIAATFYRKLTSDKL